jgi:hypothetical protein
MTRQSFGAWVSGAIGAAALWASLLISGCGNPPGQFLIVQNQVPTEQCQIPSDLGTLYRGDGVMDVRLVNDFAEFGYVVFPLMQNNYPGPGGGDPGDPNRIALSGFRVDIGLPEDAPPGPITELFNTLSSPETGPDPLIRYSIPWSGSVASGGGNTAAAVNAFPGALAREIRKTGALSTVPYVWVYSTIRALGNNLASSVESDPFRYPIRVCDGCLINRIENCPVSHAVATGNPCNLSQDGMVDCCTSGTGLVCPATVAAP